MRDTIFHFLKFHLYLFFERSNSRVTTGLVKIGIPLFIRIFSLPLSLKNDMYMEVDQGDLKSTFRRYVWFLQFYSFLPGIKVDPFFDFSIGLSSTCAEEMYRFVKSKKARNPALQQIHLAQLCARVISTGLKPGETTVLNPDSNEIFNETCFRQHIQAAASFIPITSCETHSTNPISEPDVSVIKNRVSIKSPISPPERKKSRAYFYNRIDPVFDELVGILNDLNIPVLAFGGTLLGLIREGDFLTHDYDLDFGVALSKEEYVSVLDSINRSKNLQVKNTDHPTWRLYSEEHKHFYYSKNSLPTLIKVSHKQGIHADLFLQEKSDKKTWHGSSIHGWENTDGEYIPVIFRERIIHVPEYYDRYLVESYGDWLQPVKKYNCSTGAMNSYLTASSHSICHFLILALSSDLPDGLNAVVDRMTQSGIFRLDNTKQLLLSETEPSQTVFCRAHQSSLTKHVH